MRGTASKLRVIPGRHYDHGPWAREPKLRPIMTTRPMSRYEATRAIRDWSCIGLGAAGMALLLAIMGVIG